MNRLYDRDAFAARYGARLRAARVHRQLSQAELAHRSGYTYQTVSNLERGYSFPSLTVTFVFAEVLEIHPRDLLFGEEP